MGNDVLYLSLSNEIDTFSLFRWNLIFFLYFLFVFFLSCLSSLFGCGKEKRSNLMSIFYGCVCCCCCCCCCYFWSWEGEKKWRINCGWLLFFLCGVCRLKCRFNESLAHFLLSISGGDGSATRRLDMSWFSRSSSSSYLSRYFGFISCLIGWQLILFDFLPIIFRNDEFWKPSGNWGVKQLKMCQLCPFFLSSVYQWN